MRRIYFLIPTIGSAHEIVDELRAEGMEDRHLHILAKRDTLLGDLPEAGMTIKTDLIPAIERGAVLGGASGLMTGLISLRLVGLEIAGGWVLGILLASVAIASLAAGLIGTSIGNSRLKKFKQAIEQGALLLLIDIPKDQIKAVSQFITKHHPEAEFEGMEPILPPSY